MRIPDGWKERTFGDLFDVKSGVGFKYSEYTETGIPLIKIDNVSHGYIKWENTSYLPTNYINEYPELLLNENDILLALNRPITQGMLKLAKVGKNDTPSILYQRVGKIIFKTQNADPNFYYYFFDRVIFDFVSYKSIGSDQPFISTTELKKLNILCPPLPEQMKIAQILSSWDKAIEKLEALIAAKQKRKKALMQQLLTGKKRFAGFEELWTKVELGKLFKEVKEKVGSENIFPHSITAGTGFVSHEEKWGKDISGSQYENYTLLKRGQFSYNKGNSKKYACGCMYLLKHVDEIAVPNVFISFERRKDNVCNEFYEQYFIADYCARELRRYITSGARSDGLLNLSKTDFFSVKVPSPPFKEQQKIASVLSAADKEIRAHQNQLSALKQQKRGLMQQLLTGKLRVKLES